MHAELLSGRARLSCSGRSRVSISALALSFPFAEEQGIIQIKNEVKSLSMQLRRLMVSM